MTQTAVIKLSGKNLKQTDLLLKLFASLKEQADLKAVFVHGGGIEVDSILNKLEIKTQKKDGIRVSTDEAMPYITGMLAGTCAKTLQGLALEAGLKAVSLCCTDGDTLTLQKMGEEYGKVAIARPGDSRFLEALFSLGCTPFLCSIGHLNGTLYNINADTAAVAAAALFKAPLILVSDVAGVLDGDGQVIEQIDEAKGQALIDSGIVHDGMVVKVQEALHASKLIGRSVVLTSLSKLCESGIDLSALRRLGTVFEA